jgi:hypothetical protein
MFKSFFCFFSKKTEPQEEKNEIKEHENTKVRTTKEINKLMYELDDKLHDLNISEEKKMKLMKNYKVNLDNDNIPSVYTFETQLKETQLPNQHIFKLKKLYEKQLVNRKILENDNTYDSLLFVSELSDKQLSLLKTNMLWDTKTIHFDSCIKHLQETERFHVVRYNEYDNFMNNNKIYFDDEYHKNKPKRDVLYRKINDFYFVANCDYFEKYTDFYFKLYCNVFSLFNLKCISLEYHNFYKRMTETKLGINAEVLQVENNYSSYEENNNNKGISLSFNKNDVSSTLNMRDFNNCTGEYEETNFITNLMPENLKKDMYNTTCILNLIKNRTKSGLSCFESVQNIENTNIESAETSIKAHFNLTSLPIGLFGNSKTSDYINKRVVFTMNFYDVLNDIDINNEEDGGEDSNKDSKEDKPLLSSNTEPKEKKTTRVVMRPDGTITLLKNDILGWVRMKRNNNIPELAVEAGYTKNDGKVYIGRIGQTPGKINCKINDKNKIWSFLVQGIGTTHSRQTGQVFITNLNYEWVEISQGTEIPIDSIYNGKDENGDEVWVGKSIHNEPGKIMCKKQHNDKEESNKKLPLMDKLWCHGSWCSHRKGYILTVKGNENIKELYLQELRVVNDPSEFE